MLRLTFNSSSSGQQTTKGAHLTSGLAWQASATWQLAVHTLGHPGHMWLVAAAQAHEVAVAEGAGEPGHNTTTEAGNTAQ